MHCSETLNIKNKVKILKAIQKINSKPIKIKPIKNNDIRHLLNNNRCQETLE